MCIIKMISIFSFLNITVQYRYITTSLFPSLVVTVRLSRNRYSKTIIKKYSFLCLLLFFHFVILTNLTRYNVFLLINFF